MSDVRPMIVKDEKLLKSMSGPGVCECGCGVWCESRDPNHIILRGAGGGSRLDVRANIISLRNEPCHNAYHDGRPGFPGHKQQQKRFFEIVAQRDGFESGEAVEAYLRSILALPKGSAVPEPPGCPF